MKAQNNTDTAAWPRTRDPQWIEEQLTSYRNFKETVVHKEIEVDERAASVVRKIEEMYPGRFQSEVEAHAFMHHLGMRDIYQISQENPDLTAEDLPAILAALISPKPLHS